MSENNQVIGIALQDTSQNSLLTPVEIQYIENRILSAFHENPSSIPIIQQNFTLNWRNIDGTQTHTNYSKFPDKIEYTAWKLLKEYMNDEQYFAFMEGAKIELQNKDKDHRLILDKEGNFMILRKNVGAGFVSSSGKIRSYDYPLGDEIATFIDWFQFKTEELISEWNCGTYGIVKEGQRR